MDEQVLASSEQSVAVGRDVINSIINTGDYNRFFIGDYERLRDAYIEPWQVFQRVDLAHFAGREWLLKEVDAFLHDHDRGYFVLEAEAGLGKTTFLAWLVRQRGYVHHFVELARGLEGVSLGLRNLAAQLVLAYHLSAWEAEGVLPGAAARPDFLARLLKLAADQRQAGEKVVLVVDALDEAGAPAGQNVLGLPQTLPEGVYIIASQRPVAVTLQVDTASTPRLVYRLTADSAKNQDDMRRFLEGAATWSGIARALQASGYAADQFVKTLLEKCRGVWIYLHYVIHEIERGERSPLALDELPNGMTQYYARYWQRWRDEDETAWYETYLPLLATLAAMRKSVSLDQLMWWAGIDASIPARIGKLRRLLNERWRPFLAVTEGGDGSQYRFYHATLSDFFASRVNTVMLTDAELAMIKELAAATQAAHGAIIKTFRQTQIGAGWATAPDNGYLYDELVYHLDHLADHDLSAEIELQALFANDAWLQVRVSGAGYRYDGYLADLETIWRRAHQKTLRQIEAGEEPAAFAECVRYALIRTSINSLSSNYEPALVARAIETGLWSDQRAFSVALRIPDPETRAKMLTSILGVDTVSLDVHGLAEQAGLAAALAIRYEWHRAEALTALAPQLSEELLAQGLAAALAIQHDRYRALALAALAPQLSGEIKTQTLAKGLAAALTIEYAWPRAQALAALAPQLSGEVKTQTLAKGLTAALAIQDEQSSARALAVLAPQLSGELLEQGLAAALAIQHDGYRALALAALAPQLSGEVKTQTLAKGLAAALAIQDEQSSAEALAALAPQLSGEVKTQTLAKGLAAALAIQDEQSSARALAALAPQLSGELLAQGLAAALAIQDEWPRARALAALAPQLSGELLAQGLAAALAIRNTWDRALALAALAPQMSGEIKTQTLAQGLAAALAIQDEQSSARALAVLAPQLSGEQLTQGLAAALAIQHDGYCALALAALAPQLTGEILAQGLAAALATQHDGHRADVFAALVLHLSGEVKTQTLAQELATALATQDEQSGSRALVALAPQLSEELLTQGLAALAIESEWLRADALAVLAPQLLGELLVQGLTLALAIQNEWHRARVLAALVPRLSGEDKTQTLAKGLAAALAIKDEGHRADALAALAPELSGEILTQGLAAALAIQHDGYRADVLADLLPASQDKEPLLREIRFAEVHCLWKNTRYQKREVLLSLPSNSNWFSSPIFDANTLSKITAHIIEICEHWTWL